MRQTDSRSAGRCSGDPRTAEAHSLLVLPSARSTLALAARGVAVLVCGHSVVPLCCASSAADLVVSRAARSLRVLLLLLLLALILAPDPTTLSAPAASAAAMKSQKGQLLTCDVGVKEYLVWLEKSGAIAPFIKMEIDDTHLFVEPRPHLFEELQEYLDAWHDANSFSAAQQDSLSAKQAQASMSHLPPAAQRQRRME